MCTAAPRFYEVTLKPKALSAEVAGAPEGYVRGQEVLGEWRPRSGSLVAEHRAVLRRMYFAADVERTRQLLQLRDEVGRASPAVPVAVYSLPWDLKHGRLQLADGAQTEAPTVPPAGEDTPLPPTVRQAVRVLEQVVCRRGLVAC
jgi:hypothetical protein